MQGRLFQGSKHILPDSSSVTKIEPVFRASGKGFFFVKHPKTDHVIILPLFHELTPSLLRRLADSAYKAVPTLRQLAEIEVTTRLFALHYCNWQ
jgi:hypothetical protein